MQSDPKARFSKLSTTVLWTVSIIVLIWLFFAVKDSVKVPPSPFTPGEQIASSTESAASTTPVSAAAPASQTSPQSVSVTVTPSTYSVAVKTPGGTIHAAISATDAEREQGLSGRASLPKDSGMLFVFPSAGVYGFWMKDMNFPIDMVWIGADKIVSGVAPGVLPSSYPQVFYPPAPVSYVLELASGEAAKMRIAPGSKLVF